MHIAPSLPPLSVKSLINSSWLRNMWDGMCNFGWWIHFKWIKKVTWCFAPKTCASWGTLVEPTNPTPQKNPKEGSNLEYVGTPMELDVIAFSSSNFWVAMLVISSSNQANWYSIMVMPTPWARSNWPCLRFYLSLCPCLGNHYFPMSSFSLTIFIFGRFVGMEFLM